MTSGSNARITEQIKSELSSEQKQNRGKGTSQSPIFPRVIDCDDFSSADIQGIYGKKLKSTIHGITLVAIPKEDYSRRIRKGFGQLCFVSLYKNFEVL